MNHTIATVEAEELRSMFRTVAYAADKRHVRESHRCVHLSVRDQHLTLCATDGFQLGKAWTQVEAGDTQSFGLLVDVLEIAVKMLPKIGVVEIARVEDCVTFECDSNTSHVPIMTDWSGYESVQPGDRYQTVQIDLAAALADCRRLGLTANRSAVTILEFLHMPDTTEHAGCVRMLVRTNEGREIVTTIGELRGAFEPWTYSMQYGFFSKMAASATKRNRHQDHRLSLRAERLALIETFDASGTMNALHMIAPYNDRRKR